MMQRRMVLGTAATALLAAAPWSFRPARAAVDDGRAAAFVKSVGERLVAVINGQGGVREKRTALTPIIDATVDVDGIARFCLGRFWRTAGADEQKQYVDAFRAMLVSSVARNMGDYRGVRFTVGRVEHRDDGEIVTTTIDRPNNKPSAVNWLIADAAGAPKIEDMITEGVSLRVTQRSDYLAFLANNGNNVRSLIDNLRQKLAANA